MFLLSMRSQLLDTHNSSNSSLYCFTFSARNASSFLPMIDESVSLVSLFSLLIAFPRFITD